MNALVMRPWLSLSVVTLMCVGGSLHVLAPYQPLTNTIRLLNAVLTSR